MTGPVPEGGLRSLLENIIGLRHIFDRPNSAVKKNKTKTKKEGETQDDCN